MQKLEPGRPRRLADDNLGDVVRLRKANHIVGNAPVAAWNGDRFAAQGLRQPQRIGDAVALLLGELQAALGLDIERRPGSMQPVGETLGVAHEPRRARVLAHADEQPLACRPGP